MTFKLKAKLVMTNLSEAAGVFGAESCAPWRDLDSPPLFYVEDGEPQLRGTRCADCGLNAIGLRQVCSGCVGANVAAISLGSKGVLYAYTTVHVGKSHAVPYVLGYVDLDAGARVLSVISGDNISLEIPVQLHTDGEEWWFAAIEHKDLNEGASK